MGVTVVNEYGGWGELWIPEKSTLVTMDVAAMEAQSSATGAGVLSPSVFPSGKADV